MKLDILYLIYIGYFMHMSNADGHGKDVHIKIQVPELVHKHSHTIYKKSPARHDGSYENEYKAGHGNGKDNILVNEYEHKHDRGHKHGYKHEHKPVQKNSAKQKQSKENIHKHTKKHKEDDEDFKKYLDNFKAKPEKFNDHDEFNIGPVFKKSGKSVHTEHYEVKKINPDAKFPDEKYIIKGSYKVQETDPFFDFTTTSVHAYDDPISKIAAQILTNYDYTTFDPYSRERESEDFLDGGERKEREREKVHNYNTYPSHELYDNYGAKKVKNYDYSPYPIHENYDNYGTKKEKVHAHSNTHPTYGNYDGYVAKKGKTEKVQDYSNTYPNNEKYVDYDAKKENVNDYSVHPTQGIYYDSNAKQEKVNNYKSVHPNQAQPENFGTKKAETYDYSAHPNHGALILNSPHYNYGSKELDYFVNPNYGKVETTSISHDFNPYPNYGELIFSHPYYNYGGKELDYFVNPDHGEVEINDYNYGKDWEKHVLQSVYGNDFAASNNFANKVLPEKTERSK